MATKSPSASRNAAATAGQPINLPAAIIVEGSGGELHQQAVAGQPVLTTNFGTLVSGECNSLKAGPRGPGLLEDFVLRENIFHFGHERIPERVVHARGLAAHSYFELTDSLGDYTTARILTETGVFTRFSTVAGHSTAARPLLDAAGVMDDAGIVALAINGEAQGFATLAGKGRIWAREPNVRTVY